LRHGALQLGNARTTPLRELGFATTAPTELLTHAVQQDVSLHWQVSRPRTDQARQVTSTRGQQCQDAVICYEPMCQEFDIIEVAVVKDA
jgi:thiol:disulfide interchange protein